MDAKQQKRTKCSVCERIYELRWWQVISWSHPRGKWPDGRLRNSAIAVTMCTVWVQLTLTLLFCSCSQV